MSFSFKKDELLKVGSELGIHVSALSTESSKQYINSVVSKFKPDKISGHLSIGAEATLVPLENNEFIYSKFLKSEPGFVFFDQLGYERNTVIVVEDVQRIGVLMENSFGMEYFVSNEAMDYLIAVNWYVIQIAGAADEIIEQLI